MNRKKTCLTREKRASLFVQSKKRSIQGKNPAFGIFPKATIYAETAFCKSGKQIILGSGLNRKRKRPFSAVWMEGSRHRYKDYEEP
jgi:hypothetical protein